MSNARAPVAFFAFNRPHHTERTLAALASNPEAAQTALHVFVDGPRNEDERGIIEEVAALARRARGFGSIDIHEATENQGLYTAITSGITRVLSDARRVIVVEDDILVSPNFLAYMNEALDRYETEPSVGSIHAYSPPVAGLPDYFFLRGGDCWGWATWADRWQVFNPDADKLRRLLVSSGLLSEFCNSRGSSLLIHLLRRARGCNQSWAVLWDASLFLAKRYTLHPGKSLIRNIGNDGSGIHSSASLVYDTRMATEYSGLPELSIEENHAAAATIGAFLESKSNGTRSRFKRAFIQSYTKLAFRFPFLSP